MDALRAGRAALPGRYYAMYSSYLDGIVTEPALMMVPADDHLVHRGDGVFEAFKCVDGAIYNFDAHLRRLERSAASIQLDLPVPPQRLREIVAATIRAGGRRDCALRVFVSRGPGSFGVSPYDCPASQLYVVVIAAGTPFMDLHPGGARVAVSTVAPKLPFFAAIKNCNYLPNVLMKKEAQDRGVDFVVGINAAGRLGEGATENIGIVAADGALVFPPLDGILQGTTMMRVMDLARKLVAEGLLREIRFGDIRPEDVARAREAVIVGTTINVVAVTTFEAARVGDGKPGPVHAALDRLLQEDMTSNAAVLTPVFE